MHWHRPLTAIRLGAEQSSAQTTFSFLLSHQSNADYKNLHSLFAYLLRTTTAIACMKAYFIWHAQASYMLHLNRNKTRLDRNQCCWCCCCFNRSKHTIFSLFIAKVIAVAFDDDDDDVVVVVFKEATKSPVWPVSVNKGRPAVLELVPVGCPTQLTTSALLSSAQWIGQISVVSIIFCCCFSMVRFLFHYITLVAVCQAHTNNSNNNNVQHCINEFIWHLYAFLFIVECCTIFVVYESKSHR